MRRKKKEQIVKEVKAKIAELAEAVAEEVVTERIPGQVVHGLKTPWTYGDVDRAFPPCTIMPEETIPVTYNGVRYQLLSGVEMTVPTIIRDIYFEHRRRTRDAGKSLKGMGIMVEAGAGGLPPE